MFLHSPQSAILSAVIFNALIIVALIPLALKGVKYQPLGAKTILRKNMLIYGVGGIIVPFIFIKLIDMISSPCTSRPKPSKKRNAMIGKLTLQSILQTIAWTVVCGVIYPLVMTVVAQLAFPTRRTAAWSSATGKLVGSELLAQQFTGDKYFWPRPVGLHLRLQPSGDAW
jgi:hypothetical protein